MSYEHRIIKIQSNIRGYLSRLDTRFLFSKTEEVILNNYGIWHFYNSRTFYFNIIVIWLKNIKSLKIIIINEATKRSDFTMVITPTDLWAMISRKAIAEQLK